MTGSLSLTDLTNLIEQGEVDTVVTAFPDHFGRLVGKRVTGQFFLEETVPHGMHACNYLLTVDMEMEPMPGYALTRWETGYGDFLGIPDLATLRVLPWVEKSALVLCDLVSEEGEPIEESPRRILRRQIERAAAMGFAMMAGSELEFYMFRETYGSARRKRYRDMAPGSDYLIDYHLLDTSKDEPLMRAIRNGMNAAAVPVEFSKGEWGKGQHEINLRNGSALEMADRHTIYKNGVKEIARQHDAAITFMAKWDAAASGSSCHVHSSLWDARVERNLFAGGRTQQPTEIFRWFLGGLIAATSELALCFAPSLNSYKRYQSASWAPTRLAWAVDNRTCAFRIVGRGSSLRVENRIPGADANPYLAFAATLAAGLHGIAKKIEPPPAFEGNAYEATDVPQIPISLAEATRAFDESAVARAAFGDRVVDHYALTARHEQAAFAQAVTDWELMRNFERI
jgi:glutamine synthetase